MKPSNRPQHHSGMKWQFETANFTVSFRIEREHGYKYDGDDADGETQAKLNSGEYVAFASFVDVEYDGDVIGRDALWGSVYAVDEVAQFWTAHRDSDPMNRNSSIMRDAKGSNVCICHYFPGMVSEAIREARDEMNRRKLVAESMPRMRA